MKIVSINLNGIRSAASKGIFTWLSHVQPDVICMQETKAQVYQLSDAVYQPAGYYRYFSDAQKKGYSGVAIYTKKEPKKKYLVLIKKRAEGRGMAGSFGRENFGRENLR